MLHQRVLWRRGGIPMTEDVLEIDFSIGLGM
jgi:hypothetical protein